MFQTNVVEKIKSYILFSITSFPKSHLSDIKLKINVAPGRPQMTTWRMRIACWIPKAIRTLIICTTYCFSTATMVEQRRLNVMC